VVVVLQVAMTLEHHFVVLVGVVTIRKVRSRYLSLFQLILPFNRFQLCSMSDSTGGGLIVISQYHYPRIRREASVSPSSAKTKE